MSGSLFWFLGAVSGALASALFWVFALRTGDRMLAWATALAVIVCCGAAFFLGRML